MFQRDNETEGTSESPDKAASSPPSISLPKGGGAIRGIGEKFAANPVTGTGSLSVPIYTSPGRSGFGPQLSLSYESGAGNGPFGFGWSLSLPSITRKTDKGLPKYQDAVESDVFILSGAEDLVPVPVEIGGQQYDAFPRTVNGVDYLIQRYRPRIEGLFARIERWTRDSDGDTHWRSISKDNVTTLYGKDDNSRIFDPSDPDSERPKRIFSWLICASYDDKGNAIIYEYKEEDSDDVDLSQAHESNRNNSSRSTNRYLKHIKYGNRDPNRDADWKATDPTQLSDWMFEVVFDYGEHDSDDPKPNDDEELDRNGEKKNKWLCRHDPFSSYRAGFEVRTYRLCQRVLMFHHFPGEEGVGQNCLVRSTDSAYRDIRNNPDDLKKGHPVASFIASITQSGYKRQANGGYLKKSLPPLEFEYSQVPDPEQLAQQPIQEVDAESLENLPCGLDGASYQWVDLDGEGLSGILTEQAGSWFYKRNLSPANIKRDDGRETVLASFAPAELVVQKPSLANVSGGQQQFLDLAGDGQIDLVQFAQPLSGYYERTQDESWSRFVPFESVPNLAWDDPNLKFVDLTGDGHADILITEDQVFTWYLSLAEAGFGPAERVYQALDEETGPRLVFADGTQSIYLADLSGDGLTDLARVRNGEVCYWPNLGYGRFGAKVTMDDAPQFDYPDQFNQRRVRLADIDGSGTTDIIYLGGDGVNLYFNQAGNSWSKARTLTHFPRTDNLSSVMAVDLLGNGTACLVWSSPLPGDAQQPMRYIDLMGAGAQQKPHLLVKVANNLGAETHIRYAPSTKFYLEDKREGKPWITKLPFPVHVVERVETYDRISRNRFVTRYAYHHGYFDGIEREFRGFGMVEQWDTEEFATLEADGMLEDTENLDEASHVPPVLTKTWFHTGAYLQGGRISRLYETDYYREGDESRGESGLSDEQAHSLLLPDTLLPPGLDIEEEREACRALRGSILRQEIYAEDKTDKADRPYSVSERNYTVKMLQARGENRHAIFFSHTQEAINSHYERTLVPDGDRLLADPRVSHQMTLAVDEFGNVERSVAIGYRRRDLPGTEEPEQQRTHITLTVNRFANAPDQADWYRVGLPAETRTYEIVKPPEPRTLDAIVLPFSLEEMDVLTENLFPSDGGGAELEDDKVWPYEMWDWYTNPAHTPTETRLRLIEHIRTYYRRDDLDDEQGPLDLTQVGALALPYETYKLAFTPGLLAEVYGGRVEDSMLADEGGYLHSEGDTNWWIPSGRVFYSPDPEHSPDEELDYARTHFFLPYRYRDPFHSDQVSTETYVKYDAYNLLMQETRDALNNTVNAANDYRVLQPVLSTDPNRNRTAAAFDALGMVVATAVMGKEGEDLGDLLEGFHGDPPLANLQAFIANPQAQASPLLGKATTRFVYDLERYRRAEQPPFAATLARETHFYDPLPAGGLQTQVSFSYSDGFGREIQKKIQAEAGDAPQRQADVPLSTGDIRPGDLLRDPQGEPVQANTPRRWVGSGRTVFNNKGKPVKQYEPFFSATHLYEPEPDMTDTGVSPVLFYDPVGRVVATLHPNHTYEKVVFDPWQQETYDVNDTLHPTQRYDPRSSDVFPDHTVNPVDDPDVGDYFGRLPQDEYLPTWYDLRIDAAKAIQRWPDVDPSTGVHRPGNAAIRAAEKSAAEKAAKHAATPTVAFLDVLGRTFVTVADNGLAPDGTPREYVTRVELDIEGNQREVRDEQRMPDGTLEQRIVMRYDYSIVGPEQDESGRPTDANLIHQASMEAGERWMLNDVTGKPIRSWDSRGHEFHTVYDPLRRPIESYVSEGAGPVRVEQTVYGETRSNPEVSNLRGKVVELCDQAGVVISDEYDFKGNLLRSERRLAEFVDPQGTRTPAYKTTIDWSSTVQLENDTYTSRTTYDALNRPVTVTSPDRSVYHPTFNEANLLDKVNVNLRGAGEPTPFVTDIDYNAKGQRTRIDYATKDGKLISTSYEYDKETFRLIHLYTRRGVDPLTRQGVAFTNDCDNPQPPPPTVAAPEKPPASKSCGLQNLHYTYDPIGNITHIRDDAQQRVYFDNQVVESHNDYTYDALYRLIKAEGREHIGQVGQSVPPSWDDKWRVNLTHPHDGQAMRGYTERYEYDQVGNILKVIHAAANGNWRRTYTYAEPSLIEDGTGGALPKTSNRLSSTQIGSGPPQPYTHDGHGNMTLMPHLPLMKWNYRDELQATSRQDVSDSDCTPETTYYVYGADGQRVRKVTERHAPPGYTPRRREERIYLGALEIYRKHEVDGTTPKLERETLHIMDDKQRTALVETRTQGNDPAPQQLIRYQFSNHLGSASLELDEQAQIISYEEYTPYGSTSYQAVRNQTETPKRYRYSGKERDEGSGLHYYGARYYAAWLGRWMSTDKKWLEDSLSLFEYVSSNPVKYYDLDGNGKATLVSKPLKEIIEWTSRKVAKKTGQKLYGGARRVSQRERKRLAKELGLPDIPTGTKLSKKELLKLLEEEAAKGVLKRREVHETMEAAAKTLGGPVEKALGVEGAEGAGSVIGVLVSAFAATRTKKGIKKLLGGGAGALFIALNPDVSEASGGIKGVRVDESGIHLVREVEVSNWFGWLVDVLDVTRTYEARFTITHEGVVRGWAYGGSLGRVKGRIEMTEFEEGGEGELSSPGKEEKSEQTEDDEGARPSVTFRIGEMSYEYPAPWLRENQE